MSTSSNNVTTSTVPSPSSVPSPLHQGRIELVLTAAAFAALMNELGNRSLDQIENECRLLVRRTVAASIELGKRLLFIKNSLEYGRWLEAVERIGIESRAAQKFMQATTRFINLGGLPALAGAIDSQTKLFELLPLDDGELVALDAGYTVRGVSTQTLPSMTVKTLRATLKGCSLCSTAPKNLVGLPPEVAPILGCAPNADNGTAALQVSDRVRSTYAQRLGRVVKVYADGSACVLWDDGEPQYEGLGHERVPRTMLEYVEPEETNLNAKSTSHLKTASSTETLDDHGFNVEKEIWPSGDSNRASTPDSNASSATHLNTSETYPAVYTLLPGNFNGIPVSLVRHEGRVWMIAEEVAAILGESPEAVAEMEMMIGKAFDKDFPEGCYTKATLASTSLVMRLLDQRAIRYVCSTMKDRTALDLVEWISSNHLPTGEPAAPVPIASVKPGLTIKQAIQQLEGTNLDIFTMLSKVRSQLKSIGLVLIDYKPIAADPLIPNLIEIAENLIASFEDITESQEDAIAMLEKRIYRDPEAGAALPEQVWLDLVNVLATDHKGGLTNDDLCDLVKTVDSMSKHETPEVVEAVRIVEAYADRNGAVFYDHLYEGEAPGSGRVAFSWKDGMKPNQRQRAHEAVAVH